MPAEERRTAQLIAQLTEVERARFTRIRRALDWPSDSSAARAAVLSWMNTHDPERSENAKGS